jgi:hypothetical protein
MPEEKKLTFAQQQARDKPLIEDVIPEHLDGDAQSRALAFAAYLRENKMKPAWAATNAWKCVFKGKRICALRVAVSGERAYSGPPALVVGPAIWHIDMYEETVFREGLQNIVWDNLIHCQRCYLCNGSSQKLKAAGLPPVHVGDCVVLGKEIKNLCNARPFVEIYAPDDAAIDGVTRLLELEKQAASAK